MAIFAAFCSLSLCSAIAQNTEFVPYPRSGDEPEPIVLGDPQGHLVSSDYAVPVYFGFPVRSYRILGTVIAHGASEPDRDVPRPEAVRSIVSTAKLHGAEAVIMLRLDSDERRTIAPNGQPWIIAKAIAIRWRRPGDS